MIFEGQKMDFERSGNSAGRLKRLKNILAGVGGRKNESNGFAVAVDFIKWIVKTFDGSWAERDQVHRQRKSRLK